MGEITKLYGVNNIELDPEEGLLFIEGNEGGVEVEIGQIAVMHLLAEYTDKDIDVGKDIYGIDMRDILGELDG